MTDEEHHYLMEVEELGDEFVQAMANSSVLSSEAMKGDDAVYRWLGSQWQSAIMALPAMAEEGTSYHLLQHMAAVALCIERIGVGTHGPFLATAAGLMKAYHKIYSPIASDYLRPDGETLQ